MLSYSNGQFVMALSISDIKRMDLRTAVG